MGYGNILSLAREILTLSAFFYTSKANWDAQQPKDLEKLHQKAIRIIGILLMHVPIVE